ncbi:TRIM2-like protein [Mya arenaria]|uniref:TRIM2-like protein n=1 Tax=Mya arenaria TaxID=6604 RepID=A0ABY7F026_MYAAR|nr:tripartite motif-containing protein 2-like [Mya arenaria]WAR15530.1 TRIM2-like protein [Mya arenaria]
MIGHSYSFGCVEQQVANQNSRYKGSPLDEWRLARPEDERSPMSIRRHPCKQRVTFSDVFAQSKDYGSINIRQGKERLDAVTAINETDIPDDIKNSINGDDWSLVTSSSDNSMHKGHSNQTFSHDPGDISRGEEFIRAFGEKGKGIGDFEDAKDVTFFQGGKLLITDFVNGRIQMCNVKETAITVIAPDEINQPWATCVLDGDKIAVTLCKRKQVLILSKDGEVLNSFGEDIFVCPSGIATDTKGRLIICDTGTNKVSMFEQDGKFVRHLGNPDTKDECFSTPRYVCVSVNGNIIVSDSGNHKIKIFNSNGDLINSFGSFGKGDMQLKYPYGVCSNIFGDIYVADHYNSRISIFNRDGEFIRHLLTGKNGLVHPQGLTISPDNYLYVTHGHLKATEIVIFKLTFKSSDKSDCNIISYV